MFSWLYAFERSVGELLESEALKAAVEALPVAVEAAAPPAVKLAIAALRIAIGMASR